MSQKSQNTLSSQHDNSNLDDSGKTIFDEIYTSVDPRAYCEVLSSLDYVIPTEAGPYFVDMFQRYRQRFDKQRLRVLDLGVSYGINAALLCHGMELDDLFERYTSAEAQAMTNGELLARDQQDFNIGKAHNNIELIGLDVSAPALQYAHQAGLIDEAVEADLEQGDATTEQATQLSSVDCVISTGCYGYITNITLESIIDHCAPHLPWMTHCVLRMFPLESLVEMLQRRGYQVSIRPKLLPQRCFSSTEEQQSVTAILHAAGVDTQGYEDQGWLYANVITAVTDASSGMGS